MSYNLLKLRGEVFCAWPRVRLSSVLWKFCPVRGRRILPSFLRFINSSRIDALWPMCVCNPLIQYGIDVKMIIERMSSLFPKDNIYCAFCWPSHLRSTNRFYGYVISSQKEGLVAYLKFVSGQKEKMALSSECSAIAYLDSRADLNFKYPKLLWRGDITSEVAMAAFESLPADCDTPCWGVSSWESLIRPIQMSLSAGTEKLREDGLRCCVAHGDFCGQNIKISGNDVWLFDWEEFCMDAPSLVDEMQFRLSMSVARGLNFKDAFGAWENELQTRGYGRQDIVEAMRFVVKKRGSLHVQYEDYLKGLK